MAKEELFGNKSTPQDPTSPSAQPIIRPGTVANRIQAYNDKSKSSNATARMSGSTDVQRLLTRLRQGSGANDGHSNLDTAPKPGNGSTSDSRTPLIGQNVLTIYGKRQGGGWASPAGRRLSVEGRPAVPVNLYVGVDNTDRATGALLRPTGHIGGQSSAPLDIIVPRLEKAKSSDSFALVRAVRGTEDDSKVDLTPTQLTEVDMLPLQGITEGLAYQVPGAKGPTENEVDASNRNSALSSGGGTDISSEQPEATAALTRHNTLGGSLYSMDTGYVPGGGLATDIELINLIGPAPSSVGDDKRPRQPHWNGDLTSYSASYRSRGSSSQRSEREGGLVSFLEIGEGSTIGLGQITDGPLVTSPETYHLAVPRMYQHEALSEGQLEIDRGSKPNQDDSSLDTQHNPTSNSKHDSPETSVGDQKRLTRPKLSKLPRHSSSVASLNAVLRRHDAHKMIKSSTWSNPPATQSSRRKFSFFAFLPSLFSWNEQQNNRKTEETMPESQNDTEAAAKSNDAGSDQTDVAETKQLPPSEAKAKTMSASRRSSHSADHVEGSEYASTDRNGAGQNRIIESNPQLIVTEPGQQISSSRTPVDLDVIEVAAEDATMSNNELKTPAAKESTNGWPEVTGPADTNYEVSPSTEPRDWADMPPSPTEQMSQRGSLHQEEQHVATDLVIRSPPSEDCQGAAAAKTRRVCIVVDAKEGMEVVVSVKLQPLVTTPRSVD